MVSELLVVVVGERRALPAQTFRSLQTARRRRKEPLVCWGCRGAPVQEGDGDTEKVLQETEYIRVLTATFLTASSCKCVLASDMNLLCSIQSNESQQQKQREGRESTVWQRPAREDVRTQLAHSPGGERSERRPEASHPALPPLPEGLLHQLALGSGIQAPEAALPRLVLRAGHFQEVAVEGQVVSDGVLRGTKHPPC